MNEQSPIAATAPAQLTVSALRSELGLTLAEMGERIGLSKSQMHDVEKSERASLTVALEIERLSGGRIDAADLNDGVREARRACVGVSHSSVNTTKAGRDHG